MATEAAFLAAARTQLATVSGSIVSEETIHEIRAAGRSPRNQEFAIGIPRTTPLDGPQKPTDGLPSHHSVVVIAAWQLKTKDRPSSGDTARAFAASLRTAMLARTWVSAANVAAVVVYTGMDEQPGESGWLWYTLSFTVTQTLSIS